MGVASRADSRFLRAEKNGQQMKSQDRQNVCRSVIGRCFTTMFHLLCFTYYVSLTMFHLLCFTYYQSTLTGAPPGTSQGAQASLRLLALCSFTRKHNTRRHTQAQHTQAHASTTHASTRKHTQAQHTQAHASTTHTRK